MNQHIKQLIIVGTIAATVSGTGSFFLGKSVGAPGFNPAKIGAGLEAGRGFGQKDGSPMLGARQQGAGKRGAGMVAGEIVRIDDDTITVKVGTDGSRLILLSDATAVNACGPATTNALEVGKQIMVNGTTGDDGSVTAKTIQISDSEPRPTTPSTDETTQR